MVQITQIINATLNTTQSPILYIYIYLDNIIKSQFPMPDLNLFCFIVGS